MREKERYFTLATWRHLVNAVLGGPELLCIFLHISFHKLVSGLHLECYLWSSGHTHRVLLSRLERQRTLGRHYLESVVFDDGHARLSFVFLERPHPAVHLERETESDLFSRERETRVAGVSLSLSHLDWVLRLLFSRSVRHHRHAFCLPADRRLSLRRLGDLLRGLHVLSLFLLSFSPQFSKVFVRLPLARKF